VSPLDYLWVGLAGSAGALARFVVDGQVSVYVSRRAAARSGGGRSGGGRTGGGSGGAGAGSDGGGVSPSSLARAPVGTMLINITGSLLLGFFVGLVTFDGRSDLWKTVAGTGFCGGYTTFSTASVETVRLVQDRAYRLALLSGGGTLVAGVAAAAVGMALSQV
jgi:CrcB protein